MRSLALILFLATIASPAPAPAQRADRATPGYVRVRLETADGPMVLALDAKRAPKTTANFLRYVDDGRFDGVSFYRTARQRGVPGAGFIQGGIRVDARRFLDTVEHEPTNRTGIKHLAMTISMARRGPPGSANGNFFITIQPMPSMDAGPKGAGYAAFGRVVGGQATARRILAEPTGPQMAGTLMLRPVRVNRAVRLDGVARPTGRPRPWLIERRREG